MADRDYTSSLWLIFIGLIIVAVAVNKAADKITAKCPAVEAAPDGGAK